MMHSSDESKILDRQIIEGRTTYILQDGVYLGDEFESLPCGIINKSETGMGATTLELTSPRNSIIVEPTKITASSKAHKHNALYIGSTTRYHPYKIRAKDIKAYIEDESVQPKKIVVVADSLWKVIDAIGASVYQDYYLFLDEIDSFQMDSTFRDSMEICLDYYKRFDPDKRLMVSATLVEFSDPELKDEPYTTFQYENPTVRTISLLHYADSSARGNFLGCVSDQIKTLVENFPDEKIMIAFNSVSQCFSIAVNLIGSGIAQSDEVGILCSANNKRELGEYYTELGDEELPKRINFVTSAYFTGYDLEESYHLISVSAVQNRIHSLSDKKLKQIAGRCRGTLHSEMIVYETRPMENETITTLEGLMDAAEKERLAITCLESNYESNSLLSRQLSRIRKLVLENTHDHEFRLVRRNIKEQNVISYLNIDANLENQRMRMDLYQSADSIKNLLEEQGHTITFEQKTSNSSTILTDPSLLSRVESVTELIKKLRDLNPVYDNLNLIKENLSGREKQVFDIYEEFYLHIDRNQLLDKIEEVAVGRDDRALKNLRVSARIAILPTTHTYLKRVAEYIVIGRKYTNEELVIAWNEIFQSLGFHKRFIDDEEVKALKWTKAHFKNYKVKGLPQHKITGMNPSDFSIIQPDTGEISDILKVFDVYFEQSA